MQDFQVIAVTKAEIILFDYEKNLYEEHPGHNNNTVLGDRLLSYRMV